MPLPDPLAGLRQLDPFNLAGQRGRKFVGTHAYDVLALPNQPAVPAVIGQVFGNQEAVDIIGAEPRSRGRVGFHRYGVDSLAAIQEVIQNDEDQESAENQ